MPEILKIKSPDGKIYQMPWSQKRDPTDDEIDAFILAQSKPPSKELLDRQVKPEPRSELDREIKKSVETGRPIGFKGMSSSFLPDDWRFGKDVYDPSKEEVPSFGRRAVNEIGTDFVRGATSPLGIATSLIGTGGAVFPTTRKAISSLARRALPSLFKPVKPALQTTGIAGRELLTQAPTPVPVTPISQVDELKNAEVARMATQIKPKIRPVTKDYAEVDVLNPSRPVADTMFSRGYSIVRANPDGTVRMSREVQSIVPPVSGNVGIPKFRNPGRRNPPPNKPPIGEVIPEVPPTPSPKPTLRHPSVADSAIDILAASKGFTAGIDLSAPLRQGRMLAHKKEFWTSFDDMFKGLKSEADYDAIQQSIAAKPTFELQQKSGLKITDLGDDLANREENIMSTIPEKVSIGGVRPWRASNRAYTIYLNKLRSDVFDSLIQDAKKLGRDPEMDERLAKDIAEFINNATGRGGGGKSFEGAAKALNGLFFSPRFLKSRFHFLNPHNYYKTDPFVRKEMLKSVGTMVGSQTAILSLAALAGAKVSTDMTSSDFAKIRIGNTRLDLNAGFQPLIRMLYQIGPQDLNEIKRFAPGLSFAMKLFPSEAGNIKTGMGYLTSSNDNQKYDLANPKFAGPSRMGVVGNTLIVNKLAPVASYIYQLLEGKNFEGEKFEVGKWDNKEGNFDAFMKNEEAKRVIPMIIQDLYELYQEDPNLLPLGIPAAFGGSVQSYKPKTPKRSPSSYPKR